MDFFDQLISVDVKKNMGIVGLTDEFFCVYLFQLLKKKKKSILVVVQSLYDANQLYSSLKNHMNDVYLFPMDDFLTSEALAISPDLRITRLETIHEILIDKPIIVITNLMGYLRFLPERDVYESFVLSLKVGQDISPQNLADALVLSGYTRDVLVNKTGEIGVRGFVVDVFPIGEDNPVRIEFFGDVIESIRYFDPNTQKSLKNVNSVVIRPFTEFLVRGFVDEDKFGKQKFLPSMGGVHSISDYFKDSFEIFKDYDQLEGAFSKIMDEVCSYRLSRDSSFHGEYMFSFSDIHKKFPIYYLSINNLVSSSFISSVVRFSVQTIKPFMENIDAITQNLVQWIKQRKTVLICLKKFQIRSILKNVHLKMVESTLDSVVPCQINLIEHEFNQGFIYQNVVVLTAKELFLVQDVKRKYHTNFQYTSNFIDISKLNVGDYVVHYVHGIGIYNGIKTLSSQGISKDYLEVLYQGSDKIYIPVEKIDLLSKYSGHEGVCPKINKLGGNEWKKTKDRVSKKVVDMANKLLDLYARREAAKGFAFSKDCDLSLEFENNFEYTLTPDQVKAIAQIKEDMEKPVPMDRLLCGDVGFGKTEVAFVACFKAILDSKQVLFLCPTTILSNQHYENALVRFQGFPVSIALLNRFTSPKEVRRILDGLKDGTIDLVFGTHRLLSDDVCFRDLGLLVIDEEQRFGVRHKEKVKQYKTNVDVLTLTATPIPRTLQMSMVGIRSLSLIETPPVNRYPIQTYVVEKNIQILKDAIDKELARDGQVFVLYNRVQSIEEEKFKIHQLVPNARITVAHGQMTKNELEGRIFDFVHHEYDILLCTTIIETGIDIPNVNTLIIMDADRFGLSQLYQIRGRVGRSDKFAYAYLMYEPSKVLTESAIKRLKVIQEFTELGSGFSIATRDLSIRGAGDILGSEQAGFIDSVGIDLYLKMLNDAVSLKKRDVSVHDIEMDSSSVPLLQVSTHIDDNYVCDDELKIEIHRKINEIDSLESFLSVKNELEDRFGKVNRDLIVYMYEEWFEKLANRLKISRVNQTRNSIELVIPHDVFSKLDMEVVFMDAFDVSRSFRFVHRNTDLMIVLDFIQLEKHPVYYLVSLLDKIWQKFENVID